jgi:AcrR family transcriptional regulator
MERAALELSGEVGFARMTVAALVERSGSNFDRFYRTYGDKARCYSAAYAAGMEELAAGALRACAHEAQWADGLRVALVWLAELAAAEPVVVRGLLGEAGAADRQTKQKREEVFERLSRAIDRARRETDESRHSPPPLTARFILWGIETSLLRLLDRPAAGQDPAAWLAGAIYLGVDLYLGGAAARKQVRLLGGAR